MCSQFSPSISNDLAGNHRALNDLIRQRRAPLGHFQPHIVQTVPSAVAPHSNPSIRLWRIVPVPPGVLNPHAIPARSDRSTCAGRRRHRWRTRPRLHHSADSVSPREPRLTFHAEGSAIQALVQTLQRLQISIDALQATLFRHSAHLSTHIDPELARATFNDWVPAFALPPEGLLFAVLFALLIWLLFHALWRLIAKAAPRIHFSRSARHGTK